MKATFEERLEAVEREVFPNGEKRRAPIDPASERILIACQHRVAEYFDVPRAWMLIKGRTRRVAFIRQIAMTLALELSGYPSQDVAEGFNRDDHCTVLHARKVVTKWAKDRANYLVLQELRRRVVNSTRE